VVEVWANGRLVAAGDVVEGAVGWLFGFCYGTHFWRGVFETGNVELVVKGEILKKIKTKVERSVREVRIEFILLVRMI
jgi:hypothetical protein